MSLFGKSRRGLVPILPSSTDLLVPPEAHKCCCAFKVAIMRMT